MEKTMIRCTKDVRRDLKVIAASLGVDMIVALEVIVRHYQSK